MESKIIEIEKVLSELRALTSSDFAALSWLDMQDNRIRWLAASGNLSDRYRTMSFRPGQDIAGTVLRFGRPLVIDGTGIAERRPIHPIALAERLAATAAHPIIIGREPRGALLIASRTERKFSPGDLALLEQSADVLSQLNLTFS